MLTQPTTITTKHARDLVIPLYLIKSFLEPPHCILITQLSGENITFQ